MRTKWLSIAIASFLWLVSMSAAAQQPPESSVPQPSTWPDFSSRPPDSGRPVASVPPLSPGEMLGPQSGTNISEADARRLRAAAGISDGDPSKHVVLIDGKTLHNHEILLVTSSSESACLMAEVFARHGKDFQQVWSLGSLPDGLSLCKLPGCSAPQAQATKAGDVEISIPARRYGVRSDVCDDNLVLTYHESVSSFQLEKEEMRPEWQLCDLSSEVWAAPINETKESDRLAVIEILRLPGAEDSAIVFAKTSDGPVVTAYDASQEAWSKSRNGTVLVAPSECIDAAKTALINRVRLPLTGNEAQTILDKLPKLGRYSDSNNCATSAHAKCSYTFDGMMFLVIFPDGSTATVHNPPLVPGVRGPGASATDWVEQLHILVGDPPTP